MKLSEMILKMPAWVGRKWFPLLLDLSVDQPLKLPKWSNMLSQLHTGAVHNNLTLLDMEAIRKSVSEKGYIIADMVWEICGLQNCMRDFVGPDLEEDYKLYPVRPYKWYMKRTEKIRGECS